MINVSLMRDFNLIHMKSTSIKSQKRKCLGKCTTKQIIYAEMIIVSFIFNTNLKIVSDLP